MINPALLTGTKSSRGWAVPSRLLPWLVLGGLGLTILLMRLHTYHEPLESDLTSYAVIGHEMLGGRALYTDLWDHKPPAIHLTYALAMLIFGYGRFAVFALGILPALATMLGLYRLTAYLADDRTSGLWAAAFWVVLCSLLELQANQPNVEVFMNLCLVWAVYFLARIDPAKLTIRPALASGVLFFAASAYKQNALCPLLLAGLGYCVVCCRRRSKEAWLGLLNLVAVGMPIVVGWLLIFGYFAARGRWQDFYDANVTFNRYYSGNLWRNVVRGWQWSLLFPSFLPSFKVLLPLAALGLLLPRVRPVSWSYSAFLGYLAAVPLMVMLPGQFYAHYYQLWMPALALAAGLGCYFLRRTPKISYGPLRWAAPFAICGALLAIQLPDYALSPADWSARKYDRLFLDTEAIGAELQAVLRPQESFFQWGWWSGLYFTSQHQPPTGILFPSPLRNGPLQQTLAARLLCDLDREQPEIVVAAKNEYASMDQHPPLRAWMAAHYRPSPKIHPGPALWFIRRGGRLEKEWVTGSTETAANDHPVPTILGHVEAPETDRTGSSYPVNGH